MNKMLFLIGFIFVSIVGFMVKLPRVFQNHDMALHALFYFFAYLILALLYQNKKTLIAFALAAFGILIELLQDFSNKISMRLIGKRIHGNFDPEDIKYNLIGLFTAVGILLVFNFLNNQRKNNHV